MYKWVSEGKCFFRAFSVLIDEGFALSLALFQLSHTGHSVFSEFEKLLEWKPPNL